MKDLNVNLAIWWMFMNTTLRAAVHLGKDDDMNSKFVKGSLWKTEGQLFKETVKLISGQTETTGQSQINFQEKGFGKMGDTPVESWKKQIQWYSDNN